MLRSLRIENLVLIREADLRFGPGLTALSGETGAGKTIFAQAIGLLLGAKADASAVGAAGSEAYVEAEFDVPDGFWDDERLAGLVALRPVAESGLVLARRVAADGRTRAFAWGRSVSRDDLALAAEQLIAMSGQFEQRRLARPSFQLDTLDAHLGSGQSALRTRTRNAWRALGMARTRLEEFQRDAGAAMARLAECAALVEDANGLVVGEEEVLRAERARARAASDLVGGVAAAAASLDPEEGEGAVALARRAERSVAPLVAVDPALAPLAAELEELAVRLGEAARDLHARLASVEAYPRRVEEVEARLDRIAAVRRRHNAHTLEELLERRASAEAELAERATGGDPVAVARAAVERAEGEYSAAADALAAVRAAGAAAFAAAVAAELRDVGLGDGEFLVELRRRAAGPTGHDEVVFLVRPNPGLPYAPVAETASGGELSRIALALAAVAGGETLLFDEIDAGIGGVTAHGVARVLQRLAAHAQVIAITHLPQLASVADAHLRVEKTPGDPTTTQIERLDATARRDELERMLGGSAFVASLALDAGR
ncbi:MAG: hypothetical protein EXQ77_01045 [Thermoleophilia bacterium]|nr:hypothetical protein [Thermoleophilia bacterium]